MKRIPPIPTVLVVLAAAAMIALGVWQLQRATWKEALLARFGAAQGLPPVAFPAVPNGDDALLFRRAEGFCLQVTGWRARAGRSRAGVPGWSHVAACRTGAEGPGMQVDAGWSNSGDPPRGWRGGKVGGIIGPDAKHRILLVADTPAPGLQPSAYPSLDLIPNNHRAYAVQWFVFAALALGIYALALRRRGAPPDDPARPSP